MELCRMVLQIFRVASGIDAVPLAFPASDLVGESSYVPSLAFTSPASFRRYVSACPDANYAWRFYGKLRIIIAGDYTLCTTSDDGSLLYMDLAAGRAGNPVYNLLIDNDGLHGDHQVLGPRALADFQRLHSLKARLGILALFLIQSKLGLHHFRSQLTERRLLLSSRRAGREGSSPETTQPRFIFVLVSF